MTQPYSALTTFLPEKLPSRPKPTISVLCIYFIVWPLSSGKKNTSWVNPWSAAAAVASTEYISWRCCCLLSYNLTSKASCNPTVDHRETGQASATSAEARWICGRCKVYITVPLYASIPAVCDACWQLQNAHKFLCAKTCPQHRRDQAWPRIVPEETRVLLAVAHHDTRAVQPPLSQSWLGHRTPLAWWRQDGVIVSFKASEGRPNGSPSVSVVSALLHNPLCRCRWHLWPPGSGTASTY